MSFLKKVLLIALFVLTTFCAPACELGSCDIRRVDAKEIISASAFFEKDYLNSRNDSSNLCAGQSNTSINARRNNDEEGNCSNGAIVSEFNQFKSLIKFIEPQEYLENNTELALRLLLFQIQPNAP